MLVYGELCPFNDNLVELLVNIVIYPIYSKIHRYRHVDYMPSILRLAGTKHSLTIETAALGCNDRVMCALEPRKMTD